jgi:mitotic spindle assembly checkpoint protein MAD2B
MTTNITQDKTQRWLNLLLDFFEAAIHQILFYREVYPKQLFTRAQLFGVPVQRSHAEELSNYIRNVINDLSPYLAKGTVESLMVDIIDDKEQTVSERFVFETPVLSPNEAKNDAEDLAALVEALKSVLLRISAVNSHMNQPKRDLQFAIRVNTKDESMLKSFTWIESEKENKQKTFGSLLPLRSVHESGFKMQLFVNF